MCLGIFNTLLEAILGIGVISRTLLARTEARTLGTIASAALLIASAALLVATTALLVTTALLITSTLLLTSTTLLVASTGLIAAFLGLESLLLLESVAGLIATGLVASSGLISATGLISSAGLVAFFALVAVTGLIAASGLISSTGLIALGAFLLTFFHSISVCIVARTIGATFAFGTAAIDGTLNTRTRSATAAIAMILFSVGGIETFAVFVTSLVGAEFLAPLIVVVFHRSFY